MHGKEVRLSAAHQDMYAPGALDQLKASTIQQNPVCRLAQLWVLVLRSEDRSRTTRTTRASVGRQGGQRRAGERGYPIRAHVQFVYILQHFPKTGRRGSGGVLAPRHLNVHIGFGFGFFWGSVGVFLGETGNCSPKRIRPLLVPAALSENGTKGGPGGP